MYHPRGLSRYYRMCVSVVRKSRPHQYRCVSCFNCWITLCSNNHIRWLESPTLTHKHLHHVGSPGVIIGSVVLGPYTQLVAMKSIYYRQPVGKQERRITTRSLIVHNLYNKLDSTCARVCAQVHVWEHVRKLILTYATLWKSQLDAMLIFGEIEGGTSISQAARLHSNK